MGNLKVLVTGSSGFIGSHLLGILRRDEEIEIVQFEGDLLDKDSINRFFEKNNEVDVVVHLVGLFSSNFDELIKINLVATNNLLEGLSKQKIKKFIFSSSGIVYGSSNKSLESDQLNPTTLYGLSKMLAEKCIEFYSRKNNFPHLILRFPNIFGPDQKKGAIYSLLSHIKKSGVALVDGDGEQRRDFLHVEDASGAIHKAIHSNTSGVLNISSGLNLSINELLDLFRKELEFKVEYIKSRDDVSNLSLDYQKARKEIGLKNAHSYDENIFSIARNFS